MSYSEAHELIDELTITAVLQEKDGITIPARDHFYNTDRDNLSEDRRRMVIAHEIGHIILHYGSGLVGYAADEKKQADIDAECDTFARASCLRQGFCRRTREKCPPPDFMICHRSHIGT